MSKIGKIFKKVFDFQTFGLFKKKKKNTAFNAIAAKAIADKARANAPIPKQGSEEEVAQRRERTAARLRSGRVTARAKEEEEEDIIKRPGVRRAKLLGN